jgi:hypothetical protein
VRKKGEERQKGVRAGGRGGKGN